MVWTVLLLISAIGFVKVNDNYGKYRHHHNSCLEFKKNSALLEIKGDTSAESCTTVRPIVGPDGTMNQLISCTMVENCYKKATEVCEGPYKIMNSNSETSGMSGSTSTTVNLLVQCDH